MREQQAQEPGLSEGYLNLWQELDFQILTLELCTENEARFIEEQRHKLSYKTKLLDFYAQCIEKGKVDEVKKIQPIVEQANNMFTLYMKLFTDLEQHKSAQRCTKEWVAMAEFFLVNSTIFKQMFTIKNMMMLYNQDHKVGLGFLIQLYLNNNLPAFSLFLKHSSEAPSAAFYIDDQIYSFMHALIILAGQNPNPVKFIKFALEEGVSLEATNKNTRLASAKEVRKLLPRGHRQLPIPTDHSMPKSFDQESNYIAEHASIFAMGLHTAKKHPKVIRALLPYTSIEQLAIGLGRILNSGCLINRQVTCIKRSSVQCFNSIEDCNTHLADFRGNGMALYFFPGKTTPELTQAMLLCNELLGILKHKMTSSGFDDEAKRALALKLLKMGEKETDDPAKGVNYIVAAQIMYMYITTKNEADDKFMVETLYSKMKLAPKERKADYEKKAQIMEQYFEQRNSPGEDLDEQEVMELVSSVLRGNPHLYFQPAPVADKPSDTPRPGPSQS